ncbi:MAG: hypothetical protein JNK07_14520 [Alphaproteobacteria bacterium]|nr:hypothetical protein [Alphaproteobacteria bacterium]
MQPAPEGEMKENRFFDILYGILLIPIVVIAGGTIWTFLFLAVDSSSSAFLVYVAALIVWLVFTLESLNKLIFNRQALPWLPLLPGRGMPVTYRFATLLFMYGILGFVGYKMATEPW